MIRTRAGNADRVVAAVASSRPTRYWVRACRSRSSAVSARARCIPASCPTTIPSARSRRRFSNSSGSATKSAPVGETNRKSYSRNDPNAVATAAGVPNTTATETTASR